MVIPMISNGSRDDVSADAPKVSSYIMNYNDQPTGSYDDATAAAKEDTGSLWGGGV